MKKIIPLLVLVFFLQAKAQIITTIAGNGVGGSSGNGGQATAAEISGPSAVAFDANNNMYIADSGSATIRVVNGSGIISKFAGNSFGGGYSGDGGPAITAGLNRPTSITFDAAGNSYIVDQGNQVIRKVDAAGIISTFAGKGIQGFSGDGGQATAAELNNPQNVTVDAFGNLYIADKGNNRIRRINTSGIISTVAGTGIAGYNGDGSAATASQLNGAYGVAFDAYNNMFIADCYNYRIRKVNSAGIISTIAGNGIGGYSGDGGAATLASLYWPAGIIFDGAGNLYISDFGTDRVRMLSTTGIISTVAGNGTWAYSGDGGAATLAELNGPYGIAFDAFSNLYIADILNNRIRRVTNIAVGINQITNANSQINIYPNPTNNQFIIETNATDKQTLQVFDVNGKLVLMQSISGKTNIDASNLAEGVYNLSLQNSSGVINKRLVIVR